MSDDLAEDLERLRHDAHRIAHEIRRIQKLLLDILLNPFITSKQKRDRMSAALDELAALATSLETYGTDTAAAITAALKSVPTGTGVAEADVQAAADKVTASFNDMKAAIAAALNPPVVVPPALTIASGLPAGTTGTAYSATLSVTGGTAPYAWSVTSGALPDGVTLAADGTLSGTPGTTGTFSFTVSVTDASSPPLSASANDTISVN